MNRKEATRTAEPRACEQTLLVADDDEVIRFALRDFFSALGCEVLEADSCRAIEQAFLAGAPDAAVLDVRLPDGDVLEILPRLREAAPETPIVLLTGHATIERAVRAIQMGADQFLTKPVDLPSLQLVLERLHEHRRARRQQVAGRVRLERGKPDPFLGTSPAIRLLRDDARRALGSTSPVLILGETGSGKGLLAEWIHRNGPRAAEAFVDINCAGLSRDLLESELFGHEKGAFTGAVAAKPGLLEAAHHGTVFLDEAGDMDTVVQAKLLKVLDDRRFRRVGEVRDRRVDVRVIAATHRDLSALAREQKFREDLYYRLSVLVLHVPALRDRAEDIPRIAESVLAGLLAEMGRGPTRLTPAAAEALAARPWPGNVRELRNALERAVLRASGDVLTPADFRFDAAAAVAASADDGDSLDQLERRHIARVLREEDGHVERAAKRLGIGRSTLYAKLRALGLDAS